MSGEMLLNGRKSLKKIAFDLVSAQPSIDSKFHGGGEYIKAVFEKLIERHQGKDAQVIAIYCKEAFLDDWIGELFEEKSIETVNVRSCDEMYEKLISGEIDCDVFYTGGHIIYDIGAIPAKTTKIATIHGMRDFEEPVDKYSYVYYDSFKERLKQKTKSARIEYLRKRNLERYRSFISGCDKIVCVSEHTKYAVSAFLPECRDRIAGVFYTPAKHATTPKKIESFEEKEYLLLVSANRWIKNAYRAVLAIDKLYDNGLLHQKTVLVGGLSKSILSSIKNMDKFIVLPYVDAEELEYLYQNCLLFVYPTINEGFGMPPLEAMKYGKNCVVSAICSLTELYAGSVHLVNPYSIEEMAAHILMAVEEPIDSELIRKTYDRITERQENDLAALADLIATEKN
jgi:glycosyltransferase involved in cell wall biosynthesis